MKMNYGYTIKIDINQYYLADEDKKVSFEGAMLYRIFDDQIEAKTFFENLSFFCTGSQIAISVEKDCYNENDQVIGSKIIANFNLGNEDSESQNFIELTNSINWDTDIELYNYNKKGE